MRYRGMCVSAAAAAAAAAVGAAVAAVSVATAVIVFCIHRWFCLLVCLLARLLLSCVCLFFDNLNILFQLYTS